MRLCSCECITAHAAIVQEKAFLVGVALSAGWIAAALATKPRIAVVLSILGALAFGVSAGAWILAQRFKD